MAPSAPLSTHHYPIYVGDRDFTPLRKLVDILDISGRMKQPLEGMLEYTASLEHQLQPLFHMLSVDITKEKNNRLKVMSSLPLSL